MTDRSVHDLSFVASKGTGNVSLWSPRRFRAYPEGTALGRRYADELIEFMRETQNTAALGQVLRAIMERGEETAVEIGFYQRIGDYLAAAGVEGPKRGPRGPRLPTPITPPATAPSEA